MLKNLAGSRPVFLASSVSRHGLNDLESYLRNQIKQRLSEDTGVVIQSRHLQLLENVRTQTERAIGLVESDSSEEFVAQELSESLRSIHEILGTEIDEQIIDRVFKDFCIGK